MVLLHSGLALVGGYAVSALKVDDAHKYVPSPRAESYDDIVAANVDMTDMRQLHLIGQEGKVTIMGYPTREDKEISGQLASSFSWETSLTEGLCKPWSEDNLRGNFLDVGANIGTYSLPMAQCTMRHLGGSVISVEGMPTIADHLRAGIIKNEAKNVMLYGYAVGGMDDISSVVMELDPKNKGGSSVAGNKEGDASRNVSGVKEVQVPLTNLDSMLKTNPALTAVLSAKVDIEGNEGRFFQGAQEFFGQHAPCYLMVELIHEWLAKAGTPVEDILSQLSEWGYSGVPTAEYMKNCRWRSRTIHIKQKNMNACTARVMKAYEKLLSR